MSVELTWASEPIPGKSQVPDCELSQSTSITQDNAIKAENRHKKNLRGPSKVQMPNKRLNAVPWET